MTSGVAHVLHLSFSSCQVLIQKEGRNVVGLILLHIFLYPKVEPLEAVLDVKGLQRGLQHIGQTHGEMRVIVEG